MRDFVYISKRKLFQQLDTERPRGLRAKVKAAIKAPFGLGEISIEPTSRSSPCERKELDSTIAELWGSDRAPTWFTGDVKPGDWVQFEAPMSYATIGKAVVFLDAEEGADYPSAGKVRLLLHGSAEHLSGKRPTSSTSVEELSDETAAFSNVDAESWASIWNSFIGQIEHETFREGDSPEDDGTWFRSIMSATNLAELLPAFGRRLDLPSTAAWMGGFARVTATVTESPRRPRTVFATPLSVENISTPSAEQH